MERMRNLQIAVVGSSEKEPQTLTLASEVGKTIASKGAFLICGGLGGVMEAAARGAKEKGGLTVGILPSYEMDSANLFIDVIIPSGMGHSRNILVVASADLVVALPGSHGTRSEVSLALKLGKPVLAVGAWEAMPGVKTINNINELSREIEQYC